MRIAAAGLALIAVLAAACTEARAQDKAQRIYMVTWRGVTDVERGFQNYLSERGIKTEYIVRDAGQDPGKLPGFVAEIKRLRPDLVYTWGTTATLGIAGSVDDVDSTRHVTDIPIVFTLVAAPLGARLVKSAKASGRNLTGVSHVADIRAQLAAIRAYRPFRRLGVLYNGAEENSQAGVRALREQARSESFELIERTFATDAQGKPVAAGIEALVHALKAAGAEWLYLGPDSFLFTQIGRVAASARAARLPTFATTQAVADAPGVLMGLVSNYVSVGQFTAYKAEKILRGAPPQAIPVETLARFSLVVQMEAARELDFLPPLAMFNYAEIR